VVSLNLAHPVDCVQRLGCSTETTERMREHRGFVSNS